MEESTSYFATTLMQRENSATGYAEIVKSGIGLLGDGEAGLRQALEYLERARLKSRSHSPSDNKPDDTDENGAG